MSIVTKSQCAPNCPDCNGRGRVLEWPFDEIQQKEQPGWQSCALCGGTGEIKTMYATIEQVEEKAKEVIKNEHRER